MPWWLSLPQGGDWKALKQYIKDEQARTSILNSPDIINADPETWPVAHTINNPGQGDSFSVKLQRQPIELLTGRVLKISPSRPCVTMLRFGMGSCGSTQVVQS